VQTDDLLAPATDAERVEAHRLELCTLDGSGLLGRLVGGKGDEAVLELGVELGVGRRHEHAQRPGDLVAARLEPPRGTLLARGGDGEPPLGQQQL
jgi:hypothetical protein